MEHYTKYLQLIKRDLGNTTTDNFQLDSYCRKVFGADKFKGVFALDTIPKLRNDQSCIFNLDKNSQSGSHWMGLYKDGQRHIVYDSFGRKSKVLDVPLKSYQDTEHDAEQHVSEKNCGQRVCAFLACCYTRPIAEVLTI